MKNPKVSVIIPSYNYERFVEDAIDSVLHQTFRDFELIIVDDGSKDNSPNIIKKYCENNENVFFFTHENNQNLGLSKTVQLALKHAKGEFIAFLECDDIWREDYLARKVRIFEKYPQVGIVFNDVDVFGDENRINLLKDFFNDCRARCIKKTYPTSLLIETLMLETISNFSSSVMKREVLEDLNFDSPIAPYLDWWLFSQITARHDAYFISEKLTRLRLHTQSYISNTKDEISLKEKRNMFKSLLDLLKTTYDDEKYNDLVAQILKMKADKFKSDEISKKEFVEKFKGKNVYLYGAGSYLRETLKDYNFSPLEIKGVIDADVNKSGQEILGYKIYHKSEISKLSADVILISMQEPEIIYPELKKFIKKEGLETPVITDFFNDARYKILNDKTLTKEEILTELF